MYKTCLKFVWFTSGVDFPFAYTDDAIKDADKDVINIIFFIFSHLYLVESFL